MIMLRICVPPCTSFAEDLGGLGMENPNVASRSLLNSP